MHGKARCGSEDCGGRRCQRSVWYRKQLRQCFPLRILITAAHMTFAFSTDDSETKRDNRVAAGRDLFCLPQMRLWHYPAYQVPLCDGLKLVSSTWNENRPISRRNQIRLDVNIAFSMILHCSCLSVPTISHDNQSSHVTASKHPYHSLDDDHIGTTKEVCLCGHERKSVRNPIHSEQRE